MKRMISLLLVVLLLLSGCSSIPDAYGGPALNVEVPIDSVESMHKMIYFENYDEYLKYIRKINWPYGFAEWSDISFLGEWTSFGVETPESSLPTYTSYWYSFIDDAGSEFMLYIDHTSDDKEVSAIDQAYPVVSISDEMTSMRQNPASESVIIKRSGVEYRYVPAGLLSITWVLNGVEYTISSGTALSEYPAEATDTFIGRLLSLNDADLKLALAEIKPDLETE